MLSPAEELRMARDHYDKWECLAQWIGVPALSRIVAGIVRSAHGLNEADGPGVESVESRLRRAFDRDRHLNNIPLRYWDGRDDRVRELLRRAATQAKLGRWVWSLSDSVCLLKHVAIHHVAQIGRP